MTPRFFAHLGPLARNRRAKVFGERRPESLGLGFLSIGVSEQGRRRRPLLRHGALGLTEFLPDHDNGEREENGVNNSNGCEFEAGDLVVLGQPPHPNAVVDENLRNHRRRRRQNDDETNEAQIGRVVR